MYILQLVRKLRGVLTKGILPILFWALILDIAFGTAFYFAERDVQEGLSWWDSLWWAMVTMTTVGYGDYYAQTFVGRFFISYPCMVLGIGIIGYLVGTVANELLEWATKKRKGAMKISFEKHIIICNYPNKDKVLNIIGELRAVDSMKHTRFVIIDDVLEEIPEGFSKMNIFFVKGSPTDEEILMKANVLACAGVIILAENPEEGRSDDRTYTIGSLIELIEREHGIPIKTVAELVRGRNVMTLKRANVDGLVTADGITGKLVSQEFCNPGINRVIGQILTNLEGSQLFLYPTTLEGLEIISLQKSVLEHEADIQLIGIIRAGEQILNPPKKMRLQKGDTLILLGENPEEMKVVERDMTAQTS